MARLRAAGCVFAEDEAAVLLESATDAAELHRMAERRCAGEPLEQVVGWALFCGLRVPVEPGVFVPRRRSEFLVDVAVGVAVAAAGDVAPGAPPPVVLDLCCGTGAIGAAVAAARPDVELHAVDVDPAAVTCARRAVPAAAVYLGDLFDALPETLRGHVDLLLASAPYVPTGALALMPAEARLYEARVALDGGPDGLDLYRRIAADAAPWLADRASVLFETGRGQAGSAAGILERHGFATRVHTDDERDATVVSGRRSPGTGRRR